ncbi:MAG: DUF2326 domain-containing protein [Clostridia bacterium]|nr:DUF2326 domain-containing protein [Clostridia bacterium]
MLCEIYCKEFHQQKIEFSDGFNVVLGTNAGDNSIGKSTLMLIIDYVFGGNTYSDAFDIVNNVEEHDIYFKFKFANEMYYFSRSILDRNIVWKCDERYNKINSISLDEYCDWLSKMYDMKLYGLTFRNAVGRYIRVYGKENCDEKHPLHYTPKEKEKDAIWALLKLFDKYKPIEEIAIRAESSKKAYDTFDKAQKLNYIAKISKQNYKNNEKEIERLNYEIEKISKELDTGFFDIDSAASEEAISIKNRLSRVKRIRSNILSRLTTIKENEAYRFSTTTEATHELQEFFPNINIKHIDEIEHFHKQISVVFKSELQEEKRKLERQIKEYNEIIETLENELKGLIHNPKLSKIILQRHATFLKIIERLKRENDAFCKAEELIRIKKADEESLTNIKLEQLGLIEKDINVEMDTINKKLYVDHYNAPIIHFTESNYHFITPNDTGTGIAYKGLVVFDLAIAHLTKLPILVHDSVLLKQISDEGVGNIINQYINCKKQVFVALDKQDSYNEETSALLEQYAKIKLFPNGGELFGRSWGKKHES